MTPLLALVTLPGIESFLLGECKRLGIPTGAVGDGWVLAQEAAIGLIGRAGTLRAVVQPTWIGPMPALPARWPSTQRLWFEGQLINGRARCEQVRAAVAHASGGPAMVDPARAPEANPDTDLAVLVSRRGLVLAGRPLAWGLDLRRPYRVALMARSLNPAMARALAMASRARPGDLFLDPFCGSGTVLAERAYLGPCRLVGRDLDAGAVDAARRTLAALAAGRGRCHPGQAAADTAAAPPTGVLPAPSPGSACGAGAPKARVDTAAADADPVSAAEADVRQGDARHLDLPDGCVSAMATNPPYGHRMGRAADNAALYAQALREAARVLAPGARLVVLTTDRGHLRAALRSCGPALRQRSEARAYLGGLEPTLAVYERTDARP